MSVYNGMPYLKLATESILTQTYKNFEFIIVDDASTDNSWRYLKNLKDKRIKLLKNKKNIGLASSLNEAIKLAQGAYIARMDADDISSPQRFEIQIKLLLERPQIDICGCWADLINESGQIIGEKKYPTANEAIKSALRWYTPVIHPTFMARSRVFKTLVGYNPKFDLAEDYDLLLRAKNIFKMANIPKKLLKWRLWDKRRSREQMHKMDQVDLQIKLESFRRGDFNFFYAFILAKKFLMIYFFPQPFKLWLAKLTKLA